jgi:hypothetical protein
VPRRKSSRRKRPEWTPGSLLDWTDSRHWDYLRGPRPCRYCKNPTQLRDSDGYAAHKTCAERALDEQAREAEAAYFRKETS